MHAIAKSRLQIKLKPIKGLSVKSILIFSVVGASRCSMPFLKVSKGTVASFLNPRLNGKPQVVHLNFTLMACGNSEPRKHAMIVSNLNIAQVRRKCELREVN